MLKVEGHQDLFRDENTSAIINTSTDYYKYIDKRNKRLKEQQEIESLKSDVSELKDMMHQILKKLNEQ